MRTYSFMQNLPENYSIFDMKNKRKPPVKTERRNGNLCKSKKLYPRLFGGGDTISVFNDFYIFISRYTLSLRCNRLTIRYRTV